MPNPEPKSTEQLKADLAAARLDDQRLDALMLLRDRGANLSIEERDGFLKLGVELARTCGRRDDRAKLATSLANACDNGGDPEGILRWAEVVREEAAALGSRRHEGSYHYLVGNALQHRSEYDNARGCFEKAQRLWTEEKFVPGRGAALNALASLYALQGRFAEALEYYQECLKIDEESGDDLNRAFHQFNAGFALHQLGRWEDAAESFYRTIELCERAPSSVHGDAFNSLGELYMGRNRLDRASAVFEQLAHEEDDQLVSFSVVTEAWVNLGRVRHRQGNLVDAGKAYAVALERADSVGSRRQRALALCGMAEVALAQGDLESASELVKQSAAMMVELGLKSDEAQALRVEGLVHGAKGDREAATDSFDRALFLLEDSDDSVEAARVRLNYGRFLLGASDHLAARTHLAAAVRAFRKHAVVADAEAAVLLVFEAESEADLVGALLRAVSGLKALGIDQRRFVEQVLKLMCRALALAGASIIVDGRPSVVVRPVGVAAPPGPGEMSSNLPFECAGLACSLRLEHGAGGHPDPHQVVLATVVSLISPSVASLVGQGLGSGDGSCGDPRLRYRGACSRNPAMLRVLSAVPDIAAGDAPVLVRGELGTGRHLVALAIHESGPRAARPYVKLDCSIPMHATMEKEFFGEERPVAAGGVRLGRLESACGGTLYLRGVEEAGLELQARLVALLRDRSLVRVGGTQPVAAELRVIAGAGCNLAERVSNGLLRQDLFDLLRGVELAIPPLRERPEDVEELVLHFIRSCGEQFGRLATGVSPEAMARLQHYSWPGNAPELEAAVEQGVLLARGNSIQVNDLPSKLRR